MIQFEDGDLLKSDATIIVHQVNCQGVMGSGLAKQIRDKYPSTYAKYRRVCYTNIFEPSALLGKNLYTPETRDSKPIMIANLFAQDNYGYGTQHTDYIALEICLHKLNIAANELIAKGFDVKIGIPHNLGCGRGGGDWSVVLKMIYKHLNDQNVTIYKI